MKRIGLIIGILFGITVVGVAVSPVASAVDIYQACKPGDTSVVCQAKNETGAEDLVKNIINILLTVASVVAVIMIIVGGAIPPQGFGSPLKARPSAVIPPGTLVADGA